MFESFYGLSKTPFARDIPTGQLYQSVTLEEILGRLEHAATRQLFAVVTGDCGTAKHDHYAASKILSIQKIYGNVLADSKLTPRHFSRPLGAVGLRGQFYRGDAKRIAP
jgi:hypothetical protein